jgi:DNA polymerase III subunit delta
MIVKHSDLSKNLKANTNFFLLYGSNTGLVDETINNILIPNFGNNIFNYDEGELILNTSDFEESIYNKSFFDDDKLIIINRCTDKILEIVKNLITKKISETTIILKSNVLDKRSKLRDFFEKNKEAICVPFYEDNHQSLMFIAQKFFQEKKIKISSQSINCIIERSNGNRINLKNELGKISNFCQQKVSIEIDEILKLTNLSSNYNLSELVDHCLANNKKQTINMLNENKQSSEDNIILIKTFLYKLKRLQKLQSRIEDKKSLDMVISSFKPSIFWKDKDIIKKQLKTMKLGQIKTMIRIINNLELDVKKHSQISNQITNNFIYESLDQANN